MPDLNSIQYFRDELIASYQPEKIILFGSHALRQNTPDSDVDILVILDFEGKNALKSAEILINLNPHFPIDLVVRTPEQVKERLQMNDFFIKEIIEKGIILYEAPNA